MRRYVSASLSVPLLFLLGCAGPTPGTLPPEEPDPTSPGAGSPGIGSSGKGPARGSGPGVELVSFDSLPPNHLYPGNRYPLAPQPFVTLPPDSIEARGWLRERLEAQADGLAAALLDAPARAATPPPVNDPGVDVLRALLPLSLLLRDQTRSELTRRKVERFVADLGALLDDPANPPQLDPSRFAAALAVLREHFRDSGDSRAVDLTIVLALRVVTEQADETKREPAALLAAIDALRWAFNQSGNPQLLRRATEATRLLDSASSPASRRLSPAQELVRTTQTLLDARKISSRDLESAWTKLAGPGTVGGSLADLPAAAVSMAEITDTVRATTRAAQLTALAAWPERLERVIFNALLGATSEDPRSVPKRVRTDQTAAVYTTGSTAGQAWAEYGSRLWVAAPGDGLAALSYAPCRVDSYVGEDEGTAVTLHVRSSYPFEERIEIDIEAAKKVTFPLGLFIPSWSSGATASVNRRPSLRGEAGTYLVLRREWRDGDRLVLTLPMGVRRARRTQGGLSVELGPLVFALPLDREREAGGVPGDPSSFRLTCPSVPDLFALASGPEQPFRGEVIRSPFTSFDSGNFPVRIRTEMMSVVKDAAPPGAGSQSLPLSPLARSRVGDAGPKILVPWGLAPLRLAAFPWTDLP